jgi:hypothetical protein
MKIIKTIRAYRKNGTLTFIGNDFFKINLNAFKIACDNDYHFYNEEVLNTIIAELMKIKVK